jgi:tetratricopeptide (TPR) repeat protein
MTLVLRCLVLLLSFGQQTAADANLDRVATLHEQAALAQNAGDYEEAERLHRMVVDTMGKSPDFPLFLQARMYSNLASVLNLSGNSEEALPLLHKAQALLEQDPPREFTQASTLNFNLSRAYALTGQVTEAEPDRGSKNVVPKNDQLLSRNRGVGSSFGASAGK